MPPGSRIGVETTTFALPLALPGQPPPDQVYHLVPFDPLADHPSADESALLQAELDGVDYLVVDATQARRTVPRLPWRYPVQIRFYDLLFAGRLGFTLAYTGTSYPTVLGIPIPDDGGWVDASFMDASHPPIYIFRRARHARR